MFGNDDGEHSKYCMMERLLTMLMEVDDGVEPGLYSCWITDHMVWDIDTKMISDMFEIIIDSLRNGFGAQWSMDMESAWQALLIPVLCARKVAERGGSAAG